jgi:hypothetical protein
MMSATSSAGDWFDLVAGEGAQANREGFALAGIPGLGDQSRDRRAAS